MKSCKSSEQNSTKSTDVIHMLLHHFCLMLPSEQRQLGIYLFPLMFYRTHKNYCLIFFPLFIVLNYTPGHEKLKNVFYLEVSISTCIILLISLLSLILLPICMAYFARYLNWCLGIILTQTICFLNLRMILGLLQKRDKVRLNN